MNCLFPNYVLKSDKEFYTDGKPFTKFLGRNIDTSMYSDDVLFKVPCGQCRNCRINRSSEWATRVVAESMFYEDNYFVTLTYDDDNCPIGLKKDDLRSFIKSLRQYYKRNFNHDGIRFFASGEYGGNTSRPHYHIIFFNLPINDLKFYKNSKLGHQYYNSDTLSEIWKKGFVVIGRVTVQSAAYTARYCMKKLTGEKSESFSDEFPDIEQEFMLCSNRPGIGYHFLGANFEKIFKYDKVLLPSDMDSRNFNKIPRYFKKKGAEFDNDVVEASATRLQHIGKLLREEMLNSIDLSEDEYLFEVGKSQEIRSKALTQYIL